MPKRPINKRHKERFDALSRIGCIICGGPAEIHHLTGGGVGQKETHDRTIPLCPEHHRTGGTAKIGFHHSPEAFESEYGSQELLLERTNHKLKIMEAIDE
jgi:hypothetical protein